MKRSSPQGFTLIEMVTVVAIIVVLAGLVLSVSGYVQTKAAREKTLTQIKNYTLQIEAFRNDNGSFPQSDDTDKLDPRVDVNPIGGNSGTTYQKASRYLYSCLNGDFKPEGNPDNQPEDGNHVYYAFKRDELSFNKNTDGSIKSVNYIQDPFGNCFGYSTAANAAETAYRELLKKSADTERPAGDLQKGYNPTFDIWSTGGGTTMGQVGKWIKNWGS